MTGAKMGRTMARLEDKLAILTGAARGTARAVARFYAALEAV